MKYKKNLLLLAALTVAPIARTTALSEAKEASLIIGGSIAAAVTYGILQDQITARICPEYFTKGFHWNMRGRWNGPILSRFKTILEQNENSPTIQGAVWGTIATWWVGAALSIPLVMAARLGSAPKITVHDLAKPAGVALLTTGTTATIGGIIGYIASKDKSPDQIANTYFGDLGKITILNGVKEKNYQNFTTDTFAHHAAYTGGALSGIGLIGYTIYKRCTA